MTVFAVLAHGDAATFNLTAELLDPHPVVVHVDVKTEPTPFVRNKRVAHVKERANVRWGGFSVVRATLSLYEEALQHITSEDEYIVLLSGQCVPIKPIAEIETILAADPGRVYCRAGLILDGVRQNESRVLRSWQFDRFDARATGATRRINALRRRWAYAKTPPLSPSAFDGLRVVAGSQWTAIPARAIREIIHNRALIQRGTQLFRNALAPDEIFFHTMIHSSDWGSRTFTPDPKGKGQAKTADYANLHHIDRSLTKTFTAEEILHASAGSSCFIRKVHISSDDETRRTVIALAEGYRR